MSEPTFRMTTKAKVAQSARTIKPPLYLCQFPGCGAQTSTIACPFHLSMLPIGIQGDLTTALATGEAGSYGPAMKEAMLIWTERISN